MSGYGIISQLTEPFTSAQLREGNAPGIGDCFTDSAGKRYRFVQYNSGAGAVAAVAGNAVGYYAPSGASAGAVNVVTSDVSDTAGVLAGLLMSAPATGEYCWVQVGGDAIVTTTLVSGADGNALTLSSTTDGTLKVVGAVTDAGGARCIDVTTKQVLLAAY